MQFSTDLPASLKEYDALKERSDSLRMNASTEVDAAFIEALKVEDLKRYERLMANVRRDNPNGHMDKDQALRNFILGLSTGQWRFGTYHRPAILDQALHRGTEDYLRAIYAVADSEEDNFIQLRIMEPELIDRKTRKSKHSGQYRKCEGCGRNFLARRADTRTCSPRCRKRASRRAEIDSSVFVESAQVQAVTL